MSMKKAQLIVIALLATIVGNTLFASDQAKAVTANDWKPGRIIDDVVFRNKNAMSATQIQQFLDSKVPVCDRNGAIQIYDSSYGDTVTRALFSTRRGYPATFTCLKDYRENPTTKVNNASNPDAVVPGGLTAAQLIYNASQAQNINPQVFLVLLQKEQSLVTDDWPWPKQLERATGNNCPDTAPCDPRYAWLWTQVNNAGAQFNYYVTHFDEFNYAPGWNNILYQANNPGCGTRPVYIENAFTAALYIYTPYTPNQAALNNMYGTGDACSAYGNRNFWRMFNDWFGPTLADDTLFPHPDGTLISDKVKIYVIENGTKRHILNPTIFRSQGYRWDQVVLATTGDKALPDGPVLDVYKVGTLLRAEGSPVYAVDNEGSIQKKKLVTYVGFMGLKLNWNDILVVPQSSLPVETSSLVIDGTTNPNGSLVKFSGDPKVYVIESNALHHVINGTAFVSHNYKWDDIREGTATDRLLPETGPVGIRNGSVISAAGGLYVIQNDSSVYQKRPLGPWECFAQRFQYGGANVISAPVSDLPPLVGVLLTC